MPEWLRRLELVAERMNQKLPEPMTVAEWRGIARSVADGTFAWASRFDHSTEAQSRRAHKSNKVQRERKEPRDAAIVAGAATGMTWDELAAANGVSRRTIGNVLRRYSQVTNY